MTTLPRGLPAHKERAPRQLHRGRRLGPQGRATRPATSFSSARRLQPHQATSLASRESQATRPTASAPRPPSRKAARLPAHRPRATRRRQVPGRTGSPRRSTSRMATTMLAWLPKRTPASPQLAPARPACRQTGARRAPSPSRSREPPAQPLLAKPSPSLRAGPAATRLSGRPTRGAAAPPAPRALPPSPRRAPRPVRPPTRPPADLSRFSAPRM